MKKSMIVAFFLLFFSAIFASPAKAQVPTFDCSKSIQVYTDVTTGNLYACKITAGVGTWVPAIGGSVFGTAPATPNGVTFTGCETPSGGVAGALGFCWPGITVTSQTGATYTLAAADRSTCIEANNAGAQTYTIPDAGGTNFQFGYNFCIVNLGAGTITFNRTSASTFNLFGALTGAAQTTFNLTQWQAAYFYTSPNNNWDVVVVSTSGAALSAITAAIASHTIANGNNPQTWNCAETTDAQDCMAFGETSAATGGTLTSGLANQAILAVSTATNSTATPLEVAQGSITNTVATPAMQIEATWNNASLVGKGILFNLTNTASNATSRLLDLQSGNVSQFGVGPSGLVEFEGSAAITLGQPAQNINSTNGWKWCGKQAAGCFAIGDFANDFLIDSGNAGANRWFSFGNPSSGQWLNNATAARPDGNATYSIAAQGSTEVTENTCANITNLAGETVICPDVSTHEVLATTNGVSTATPGMLVRRQSSPTSQKAETTSADANVLTYTPVALAGTYRACVVVSVSSATSGVISWTLSWTDSNGNAQSNVAQDLFQQGTAAPNTTFTTSAAGNYNGCTTFDVNNAAANVVVKWVGGGTTAAKMSATIEKLQ